MQEPTSTYYFVDKDGTELVSNSKPFRTTHLFNDNHDVIEMWDTDKEIDIVEIPHGTIKSLFNTSLTYDDDPIEVKWNHTLT